MTYTINYHTGAGNQTIESGNLDEVKSIADKSACYTRQPITIEDEQGNEISRRDWWGVKYDEADAQESNPICFGSYGYYSDWQDA